MGVRGGCVCGYHVFEVSGHLAGGKTFLDVVSGGFSEPVSAGGITDELLQGIDDGINGWLGQESAGPAVDECLIEGTRIGSDEGFSGGHRFEHGHGQAFLPFAAKAADVEGLDQMWDVLAVAEQEESVIEEVCGFCESLDVLTAWSVPDDVETGLGASPREDLRGLNEEVMSLVLAKICEDGNGDVFVVKSEFGPRRGSLIGLVKGVDVDSIGDDGNAFLGDVFQFCQGPSMPLPKRDELVHKGEEQPVDWFKSGMGGMGKDMGPNDEFGFGGPGGECGPEHAVSAAANGDDHIDGFAANEPSKADEAGEVDLVVE